MYTVAHWLSGHFENFDVRNVKKSAEMWLCETKNA